MILPKISKHQTYILYLLYKFRFLHTNQIQKLLNHKNPHRTQDWLKELRELGFIKLYKKPQSFEDRSKPYIYHLGLKGRHLLKNDPEIDLKVLHKVYKKKNLSKKFVDCCLTIADLYVFFLSGIGENVEFNFFTENELINYPFFPQTEPGAGAYITIKKDTVTRRYLLEYFSKELTLKALHFKFHKYLEYAEMGDWQANSNGEPLPTLLFVFALRLRKTHMKFYARGVLENKIDEKIELFVTTKDKIFPGNKSVWETV